MSATITIGGVDKSTLVDFKTFRIDDYLTARVNVCRFIVNTPNTYTPEVGLEVVVTESGTKLFGGYITRRKCYRLEGANLRYEIECQDYTVLMTKTLAVKTYTDSTCATIIADLISSYCSGYGLTETNVETGPTLDRIQFDYMNIADCLKKICKYTGYDWYVDYDKDIHFIETVSHAAAFDVTDSTAVEDLEIEKDISKVRNRIFVRGGTYLSTSYTQNELGDGTKKDFALEHSAHNLVVTVNAVGQTVGTGYLHEDDLDDVTYNCLNYYQQAFVRFHTAPPNGEAVNFTYTYDIPVLIRRQDLASIEAMKTIGGADAADGIREMYIKDFSLKDKDEARTRADYEIEKYSNPRFSGSYRTRTSGLVSGTVQNINSTDLNENEDFIITQVTIRLKPNGKHSYDVKLEGRLYGLTELLLELLDKSDVLIEREDEVLDKIHVLTESVGADDSDTYTKTTHSGTYVYDHATSKYGFAQYS